jgi:Carboxypeptidase regulatory-like domain
MINLKDRTIYLIPLLAFAAFLCARVPVFAEMEITKNVGVRTGGFGVIKGVVRDQAGTAIADATVAVFKVGTSQLLKQVKSASDGTFIARILPGTYTVLAVAEGFNPVTISSVDVGRSAELVYGFNLVRAGNGNTLHEKALDKNSAKWRIRAANAQRTIYQNVEGKTPVDENASATASLEIPKSDEQPSSRRGQTIVETYFAGSANGNYSGVNAATFIPLTENAEIILAGQASSGKNGPNRIETQFRIRPNTRHQLGFTASAGRLGTITSKGRDKSLDQLSFQALDEWTVREGVVLVFGADYSRLVGVGSDASLSPRLGLQFDVDSKTRFRAAYTAPTEKRSWSDVADLEDAQVAFQEPVAVEDLIVNGHPRLNKSRRFEIGIERVLDNKSSIETTAFFDTTLGRGVGLTNLPFDTLDGTGFGTLVANQQGRAQGLRLVYNRRISPTFSATAGYSFGSGQKLSGDISDPSKIFDNSFFQSLFGQLTADFKTGTNVRTIFRLSPQATVFAIDPFQGRLVIYDPSLSVMVTQNLPTFGIPVHAEAIVDARNLFDISNGINTEDGTLRINSQRRLLRGGILVRF